ncbi:hypothetical protein O4H61_03365 [Roseovarius aestuarii]|nr:hypothetical protein [Roseovarius aestuarii]
MIRAPVQAVPVQPDRRRAVGIHALINWAFSREFAQLDWGDVVSQLNGARAAVGVEYVMMQRGATGARIDGGGRSWPADDAQVVADAVAHLPLTHGGRAMALQIAELARVGAVPDAMVGARPRFRPVAWHRNQNGMRAATEECGPPIARRNRKGVLVHDKVLVCPLCIEPQPNQIAHARRNYLQWWGALLELRLVLDRQGLLSVHRLTEAMPPRTPWSKTC